MTTSKTYSPKPRDVERRWYVVDADGAVLGRLASEVAKILRGKHKPIFAPHMDTGDHVIVVNAGGARLTGGKEEKKIYYRHSQYPGGLREIEYSRMLTERPVLAVEKAIKGMLPKNRLGRQIFRKLSVYRGPEHPHQAQQPVALRLGEVPPWSGLPEQKPKPAEAKPKSATRKRSTAEEAPKTSASKPRSAKSTARGTRTASAVAAEAPKGRQAGRFARASLRKRSTAKEAPSQTRATGRRSSKDRAKGKDREG